MPFKTFTAGETLEASEVNDYLMEQSVMVFTDASARSSAITAAEGMVTYLTGTNSLEYYDGSSWVAVATAASVSAISSRDVLVRYYMEVL
jgi:hypothetical protein